MMEQLLTIVDWFSMPVKAGWAIFLVWALLQVAWYRRARSATPALRPLPPMQAEPRHPARKPAAPAPAASVRPYGESDARGGSAYG